MSKQTSPAPIELSRILAGQQHAPVVYFARMGDNVKIGTTTNLKARMRVFYLSLDDVLAVVPGGEEMEAAYHQRFAASRIEDDGRLELFHLDYRLSYFLGLWRRSPKNDRRLGLPFHFMPKCEVGNFLALDGELRTIEGGGVGPWDLEKVADLVGRLTYLASTADDGDDGRDMAYYWNATHEQCVTELTERRAEVLCDRPRWWFLTAAGRREWRNEIAMQEAIQAHGERAAIIRDLFVEALQGYDSGTRVRS